jgi:hypothetical protein
MEADLKRFEAYALITTGINLQEHIVTSQLKLGLSALSDWRLRHDYGFILGFRQLPSFEYLFLCLIERLGPHGRSTNGRLANLRDNRIFIAWSRRKIATSYEAWSFSTVFKFLPSGLL